MSAIFSIISLTFYFLLGILIPTISIILIIIIVLRFRARKQYTYPVPNPNERNEVIVITGCDSGIGKNTALHFASLNYIVIAGCYNEESIEKLATIDLEEKMNSIKDKPDNFKGKIIGYQVDITNSKSVNLFGEHIKKELEIDDRRLCGVLNNAGIITRSPVELQPIDEIVKQFDVNVFGQIRVIQELVPILRTQNPPGRVVNLISIAGKSTTPLLGAYSASKHAMESFNDALRIELMPSKISVTGIEPGIIETPMIDGIREEIDKYWNDQSKKLYPELYEMDTSLSSNIMGSPVQYVSLAIDDAITNPNPKTRYVVGTDAAAFTFFNYILTDRLLDQLQSDIVSLLKSFSKKKIKSKY